jgi:transposase
MDTQHAYALIEYTVKRHGAVDGCQLIGEKLGISWNTVYGWYRRGNVPGWRLEALERIRPALLSIGDTQTAEV